MRGGQIIHIVPPRGQAAQATSEGRVLCSFFTFLLLLSYSSGKSRNLNVINVIGRGGRGKRQTPKKCLLMYRGVKVQRCQAKADDIYEVTLSSLLTSVTIIQLNWWIV